MAFNSRVFQLLVASPGDVQEERQAIVKMVHEWNVLNSDERQAVILPVLWETHSSPELGQASQTIINRQIGDQCDFVVSVFSTRMGTPTENAESGTAEEIDRAGNAGKPVMLYFSNSPVHPDQIDPDQLVRVREFKAKSYPRGLVENYDSLAEFREKFSRQLAQTAKGLIDRDAKEVSKILGPLKEIPIIISVARGSVPEALPSPGALQVANVTCTDEEDIPDYVEPPFIMSSLSPSVITTGSPSVITTGQSLVANNFLTQGVNKNYYREIVQYYCLARRFQSLRFSIENPSDEGLRDLYFEIKVESATDEGNLLFSTDFPQTPEKQTSYGTINYGFGNFTWPAQPGPVSRQIEVGEDGSRMNLELPVLQPRRTVYSNNSFYLGAVTPVTAVFNAIIYSGSAPPASREIQLCVQVVEEEIAYREVLAAFGIDIKGAS